MSGELADGETFINSSQLVRENTTNMPTPIAMIVRLAPFPFDSI